MLGRDTMDRAPSTRAFFRERVSSPSSGVSQGSIDQHHPPPPPPPRHDNTRLPPHLPPSPPPPPEPRYAQHSHELSDLLGSRIRDSEQTFSINVSDYESDDSRASLDFHHEPRPTSSGGSSGSKTNLRLSLYVPLYRAALKGDWATAKEFLTLHPGALNVRVTKGWETVLHIAVGAKHMTFVEEVVKLMSPTDLALRNKDNNTALCIAAASGITRIAEVMVKKNKSLPSIRGNKGYMPLYMAALFGNRDMVWYLYSLTSDDDLTEDDYIGVLITAISANLFDLALHIIQNQPKLALRRDANGETALHVLARKPSVFASNCRLGIWDRLIYPWVYVNLPAKCSNSSRCPRLYCWKISEALPCLAGHLRRTFEVFVPSIQTLHDKKLMNMQVAKLVNLLCQEILLMEDLYISDLLRIPSQPLFTAAEFGIIEIISDLVRSYPDLIWKVDENSRSIFHIAVIHRQEKIFNLIHDIGAYKDMIISYKDVNSTNMLHLAGKLAPPNRLNIVSGAALQMQRELLWFKELEKHVQPLCKDMKDIDGRTPQVLFTDEHQKLVREGEKWMKDTASSCMVVATLITTVMFSAIFTVPGGLNQTTGTPIYVNRKSFIVFTISDALALFSSVISTFMFLSILTSRYAEEDFVESLPQRLTIGLTTLFFSIASMLVTFVTTFYMVIGHRLDWILVPVAVVACIPITLFASLQLPLLLDMVEQSSYGPGIFTRSDKDLLY